MEWNLVSCLAVQSKITRHTGGSSEVRWKSGV